VKACESRRGLKSQFGTTIDSFKSNEILVTSVKCLLTCVVTLKKIVFCDSDV